MSRHVLITGADGFIGSHLAEALVERGDAVRAMVLYDFQGRAGWLDAIPDDRRAEIEVVPGDVRDFETVARAVTGCEVVFHLAALIAIPYSYRAARSYVDVNVTGTLNVLEAVRRSDVQRLIHTSTSEVYGTAQRVPIDEEHPLNGQSPYAASKIGADQMALAYHRSHGVPVAVLRPFNTYGPRQSARAVIPTVISQIAAGRRTLELGSLTPTRDFSFVSDTVRGFQSLALGGDATLGTVFNVGSGHEISIGDLVRLVADIMDVEVEVTQTEERVRPDASEVERLLADASRAREMIGWEPEFGGRDGLRRGLAVTAEWFRDPRNLARYRPEDFQL